jgi:outer membrane protein assembly factor BamB
MMHRLAALTGLLIVAAPVLAQRDSTVYTQPSIPSLRDLDRLNLDLSWKTYIPIDNRSDGIASVQIVENRIYVQTRANVLIVLNENTGEEIWRRPFPRRYLPVLPLAVIRELVLVVNGPVLYLLDRTDGKMKYSVELPATVCAGLATDAQQCFLALANDRVISVGLTPEDIQPGLRVRPLIDRPEPPSGVTPNGPSISALVTAGNRTPSLATVNSLSAPFKYTGKDISPSYAVSETLRNPYVLENGNRSPSIQIMNSMRQVTQFTEINSQDTPRILWELQNHRRVETTPILFDGEMDHFVVMAAADRVFVCDKYARKGNTIHHEYLADSNISAPLARYGPELYFCVADGNVYWVHIESFHNPEVPVLHVKRYTADSAIDRIPLITDDSIYLASSQGGVTRLDRQTFARVWSNPEVNQVFAVNPNLVYAGNRSGDLVVLDRKRGSKLASLDIKGFNFPILNDQDDRLLLAGSNGLLICLRDRTFRRAVPLRQNEPKPAVDAREAAKEPAQPKKEVEPKKEPEVKKEVEPKKEPEVKKEVEPKKEPDAKKEVEPKKEPENKKEEPKKEAEQKKEPDPKKEP